MKRKTFYLHFPGILDTAALTVRACSLRVTGRSPAAVSGAVCELLLGLSRPGRGQTLCPPLHAVYLSAASSPNIGVHKELAVSLTHQKV